VNYASSKESADKLVKEITGNGGQAISVQADVSKEAVFLASDDAAWITGEQISFSGGMYGF